MFLTQLFEHPAYYLTVVAVVIVSVTLHELGHVIAATWEGDPTPRIRGHVTWNPVVHMGWLALGLLLVAGITFGRTPVTPARFRHRRWGEALVALAGPASNLLLAFVSTFVVVAIASRIDFSASAKDLPVTALFCLKMLELNVILFLINLIPLPPLDGFTVAEGTFDLGGLGDSLRRLGFLPLVLAILLVNSDAFGRVIVVVLGVIMVPARLVAGAL